MSDIFRNISEIIFLGSETKQPEAVMVSFLFMVVGEIPYSRPLTLTVVNSMCPGMSPVAAFHSSLPSRL